jgi:hypothetical protein
MPCSLANRDVNRACVPIRISYARRTEMKRSGEGDTILCICDTYSAMWRTHWGGVQPLFALVCCLTRITHARAYAPLCSPHLERRNRTTRSGNAPGWRAPNPRGHCSALLMHFYRGHTPVQLGSPQTCPELFEKVGPAAENSCSLHRVPDTNHPPHRMC